jgi:homoprotocatechuate degradation regulator HpaR
MSGEDSSGGRPVARKALPMRAFSESLPMALLRTREAVMCLFRPGLRNRGVTEQQWRILRALAHGGPMEVTELADATFLLGPSLSRILPDMEKRQLVSRKQVDSDLRRSVVSLEPKGLRLISAHAPDSEEIYAQIAERFGVERVTQLFTLLHELQETIDGIAPEQKTVARTRKRRGE